MFISNVRNTNTPTQFTIGLDTRKRSYEILTPDVVVPIKIVVFRYFYLITVFVLQVVRTATTLLGFVSVHRIYVKNVRNYINRLNKNQKSSNRYAYLTEWPSESNRGPWTVPRRLTLQFRHVHAAPHQGERFGTRP